MAKYVPPFRKQEVSEASESSRWSRSDFGKSEATGKSDKSDKSDTGRWDRMNRNDYGKRDSTYGRSEATYGRSEATGKSDNRSDRNKPNSDAASAMDKLTMEDFPSLSKKSVGASPSFPKGRMTYASLAANWAEQVKENEEKARKLAEEEAEKKRIQDKINEVKIVAISKGVLPKRKSDSDDDKEIDIGCANSDHSSYSDGPDNYDVDIPDESEEEEEVEDPDAFWTQRKNRNDMY
jgi:hypothetical protein